MKSEYAALGNDSEKKGKTEFLGKKIPVLLPLCPSKSLLNWRRAIISLTSINCSVLPQETKLCCERERERETVSFIYKQEQSLHVDKVKYDSV